MMLKEAEMTPNIEISSGNIYADLEMPDAETMQLKAQLASKITDIIKHKRMTQTEAARLLGMTQPKLSHLLRGQFRGISETKMLECLTLLGRDVQIVIGKSRRTPKAGSLNVIFS